MSNSPSLENKKLPPADAPQPQKKSRGLFTRKEKAEPTDVLNEKPKDAAVDAPASTATKKIDPISFTQLFRYIPPSLCYISRLNLRSFSRFTTVPELLANAIGLVAAAAADAAQVHVLPNPS